MTEPAQIIDALASEGFTCDWASDGQGSANCEAPKVMIFVDPAPELGGSLLASKKRLFETMFVGNGGAVFSGDSYVVGASGRAQTAMWKILGLTDQSAAPTATSSTPARRWSEGERALIADWGYDPESSDSQTLIESARHVCDTLKGQDTDTLTAALLGETQEKRDTARKVVRRLCPRDDFDQAAKVADQSFEEGQYTVGDGRDLTVAPGTYKTLKGIRDCYWVRKDASGKIIDNDLVKSAPGGVRVTIKAGDAQFDSRGCGGAWLRVI